MKNHHVIIHSQGKKRGGYYIVNADQFYKESKDFG